MKRILIIITSSILWLSSFAQIEDDLFILDQNGVPFVGNRDSLLRLFQVSPAGTSQPVQPYLAVLANSQVAKARGEKLPAEGLTVFIQDDLSRWQTVAVFLRYQTSDTSGHIKQILVSPQKDKVAIKINSEYLRGEEWFLYKIKLYEKLLWVDVEKSTKQKTDEKVKKWIK